MTAATWGVIGGGMLGASLALRLRDQGHQVTLIEADAEIGGLAAPWTIDDVVWDRHYHVILNSDTHLLDLIDRIGLTDELRWADTRTGVYANGQLHSVSSPTEYLRFPLLNPIDKARMAWTILYASRIRDWTSLEKVPVETWLRRHSGDRAFEKFWLPLLRSKLGDNYKQTSAAFIWATIQRLYSARRQGLKREVFGYVEGGYARILAALSNVLREAGVEVSLGQPVQAVSWSDDGVEVEVGQENHRFDHVVVTLAAPIAARLLPELDSDARRRMRDVPYQGIVCASLLTDQPLGDFYVTNITDDWLPFTGVIEMTTIVDRAEFGGRSLVYLPRYTSPTDEVALMSDGDLEGLFLSALEKMYPEFERRNVSAFKVSRVTHVFPIPTVGYSQELPRIRVAERVSAVNSAHILNGTLNVNETLQLAARVMPIITGSSESERDALGRQAAAIGSGVN